MLSSKLAPEIRALLEGMAAQGGPPLESLPPAEARAAASGMAALAGEPEPVERIENRQIDGPHGPFGIRLYRPSAHGMLPCIVWFHGGGWVVGNLDSHDNICRAIARRAGCVVVSVDYPLSPEAKFPVPFDACHAATKWVAAHAAELGADPSRIAVGGDSCGGNMATAVAARCRDEKSPAIAMQVLVYPWMNLAELDTPSRREFDSDHFLTGSGLKWFAGHYLTKPEDAHNPQASPELLADLRRLPPALVITAECDPLRDEGEAYARRMQDSGVAVTCTRYPGMIHPFLGMLGATPSAGKAIDAIAAALKGMAAVRA